jgi:hypothetical protein
MPLRWIQLEAAFWVLIDEIAEKQGMTTARFLSTLYDEALEINGRGFELQFTAADEPSNLLHVEPGRVSASGPFPHRGGRIASVAPQSNSAFPRMTEISIAWFSCYSGRKFCALSWSCASPNADACSCDRYRD